MAIERMYQPGPGATCFVLGYIKVSYHCCGQLLQHAILSLLGNLSIFWCNSLNTSEHLFGLLHKLLSQLSCVHKIIISPFRFDATILQPARRWGVLPDTRGF